MVEPVTLGVIAAPLVAKALDRAEDDTVDAGEGALRRLIGFLRRRFSHGLGSGIPGRARGGWRDAPGRGRSSR